MKLTWKKPANQKGCKIVSLFFNANWPDLKTIHYTKLYTESKTGLVLC